MKRLLFLLLAAGLARAGFTRIDTGDIANDSGWTYGCAWADYSGDGYPDLFLVNNRTQDKNNSLYINRRDGTFRRVLVGPVVTDGGSSYGCAWGDYDNSGLPGLFVSNYNENNFLYANNGDSSFTKVTAGRVVTDGGKSTGCAWADYDCDGRLDLFVCNRGEMNFLYHNDGGAFSRVTSGAIATDVDNTSGCAWADYDNDRLPDLIVANVQTPCCLYHNEGGGTFSKVTSGPPVTDTSFCNGASWGDMDNDGDLDLFVATGVLGMYPDLLYRNDGDGTFTKVTDSPVVRDPTWSGGGAWADWDNDADLDLFVGGYDGHNRMYENDGTGTFTSVDTGVVVADGNYIMGSAWADYDRDGDLDLFTARNNFYGGASRLFRNDGNGNSWLGVTCIGTVSNRGGVGARVRVRSDVRGQSVSQIREVTTQSGGGNSGESEPIASFGLGDASIVDSLVVLWPSGLTDILTDVAVNRYLAVTEGQTAITEPGYGTPSANSRAASVASGSLRLAGPGRLLDAAGREVMPLARGENDVRQLPPGVYFAHQTGAAGQTPGSVRKVVVTD